MNSSLSKIKSLYKNTYFNIKWLEDRCGDVYEGKEEGEKRKINKKNVKGENHLRSKIWAL